MSIYDDIDGLNIADYSKIYELVTVTSYRNKNIDYSNYIVKDRDGFILTEMDIENIIEKMIDAEIQNRAKEEFEKHRIVKTDSEKYDVYITDLYIRYEMYSKNIESVDVEGYILEK